MDYLVQKTPYSEMMIFGQVDSAVQGTIKFLERQGVTVTVHDEQVDSNLPRTEQFLIDNGLRSNVPNQQPNMDVGEGKENVPVDNNVSKRALGQRLRREREKNQPKLDTSLTANVNTTKIRRAKLQCYGGKGKTKVIPNNHAIPLKGILNGATKSRVQEGNDIVNAPSTYCVNDQRSKRKATIVEKGKSKYVGVNATNIANNRDCAIPSKCVVIGPAKSPIAKGIDEPGKENAGSIQKGKRKVVFIQNWDIIVEELKKTIKKQKYNGGGHWKLANKISVIFPPCSKLVHIDAESFDIVMHKMFGAVGDT